MDGGTEPCGKGVKAQRPERREGGERITRGARSGDEERKAGGNGEVDDPGGTADTSSKTSTVSRLAATVDESGTGTGGKARFRCC